MFEKRELVLTAKMLRKNPLSIVGSIIVVAFLATAIVSALGGSKVTPYDPFRINLDEMTQAPSKEHLFGTDQLGRDILSRLIFGVPEDLEIAVVIVAVSIFIGLLLGAVAGYHGRRIDEILMRTTDLFFAFPTVVLALAVSMALVPGVVNLTIALIIVWWPVYARIARAESISVTEKPYVEAARAAGLSSWQIIGTHVVPNIISPLLIYATLDLGMVIIYASVLSYLGLGVQPPYPEFGRMVYEGQTLLRCAWWVSIIPGVILFIVVVGFSLLGDALRDTLDPRMRKFIK
jgi:peptide/nickel transport system permease protein